MRALHRAPLGDPTLYEVRGTQLCLRRSEARRVQVRVPAAPGPLGAVDLRDEAVPGDGSDLALRPWQVATLRCRPAG